MIITTTPSVEGRKIKEYKGIVTGETIVGANVMKDIMASFTDFFGGRAGAYEDELKNAREEAIKEMENRATALGASAVVGVDIDYEVLGQKGSMLMVSVSGTAVVLE